MQTCTAEIDMVFKESSISMTVEQLEKELEMMEIPQELYSIMVGGLPNEKLCIAKEDKWQVYYSERGRKGGLNLFETESEACEFFLQKMKRYARK